MTQDLPIASQQPAANNPRPLPESILNLRYTKHAQRARCTDEFGCIERVPQNFHLKGCKKAYWKDDAVKAIYAYDDEFDLALIIDPATAVVITCYRYPQPNRGSMRGRFFGQFAKTKAGHRTV
jgi:hypothetical protein